MFEDPADLAYFLDNSDDLFAVLAADGSILELNAAWTRRLGYGAEQIQSAKLPDLAAAAGRDALASALTLAAAEPGAAGPSALTVAIRGADEREHPCQVSLDRGGQGRVRARLRLLPVEAPAPSEHRRMEALLRLLEAAPLIVWQVDRDGVFALSEGGGLAGLGLKPGQVVGANVFEVYRNVPTIVSSIRRALGGEEIQYQSTLGARHYSTLYLPLCDDKGVVTGVMGMSVDSTERYEAEQAVRERERQIEENRRVMQAMATPILQVWDGVLCVPVIGYVDQRRATSMTETILAAVVARRARHVIFDLTGVDHIDTETAACFVRIFKAVVLLGARGVIAGIQPPVAQALIHLGVDLPIATCGTLEDGLRRCMRERDAAARS